MSERTEIQAQVIATLKQLGIFHLRLNSGKVQKGSRWITLCPAGTGDILVMPDHKLPIWLETKAEGTISREQYDFMEQVRLLGHRYHVIRSLDDLQPLLKNMR